MIARHRKFLLLRNVPPASAGFARRHLGGGGILRNATGASATLASRWSRPGTAATASATATATTSGPSMATVLRCSKHATAVPSAIAERKTPESGERRREFPPGRPLLAGSSSGSGSTAVAANPGMAAFSTKAVLHTHSGGSATRARDIDYDGVSDEVAKLINDHAKHSPTSVSLQALMRTGRGEYLARHFDTHPNLVKEHTATELVLMQVASFLRRELPIRLAHRVQDLEKVPHMKDVQSVKEVKQLYIQSLLELLEFDKKIVSADQEVAFSRLVEGIYERHSRVLVQMARGAYEFRHHIHTQSTTPNSRSKSPKERFAKMETTHAFLDRFYLCRIGIRVLIGQYLALRQPPVDHYVGIICSVTSPHEIVKRAIDDAAFMCNRKYGDAPEVIMTGKLDRTLAYVPTHLHYIMLELLKNSMRATVEWHGSDADDFPPIKVIIADGSDNEDVVIKVSDEGGGIPRSNVKKIWSYLFTTADPSIQEGMVGVDENEAVDHGIDSPLAGLGYGLPISRSYCRYFGGDLSIMSMEGYGTDAFVYLARLGNTKEPVPI